MAKRNRITAQLSQTISESAPLVKTVPKQIPLDGTEQYLEIEISKLSQNPFQPRIEIETNELSELVLSIEKNGLLQPILATPNEVGGYTILAGHRRAEAFKILGREKIPSMHKKSVSRQDMAVFAIAENAIRVDLNPIEFALSMQHLLNEGVVESQNKLAEHIGLSKGHVSKLMSILKLPSDIIKIIKDDNYKIVYILSLLNKVAPQDIKEAYEAIKFLSREDAQTVLKTKYLNREKNLQLLPIFKLKQTKERVKIEINTSEMEQEKIIKLNEAIKKLVEDFS